MADKCRAIPTVAVMAMAMAVVAVAVLTMAVAVAAAGIAANDHDSLFDPSSLTTWSAPDCTGETSTIVWPGCTDVVSYAGIEFHYRGEAATLYSYIGTGCSGDSYRVFEDTQTQACGDVGWRSVNIDS